MNKKILLKTLLTTSTVGILGGGIASSLTLTSCSNRQDIWLSSYKDAWNYLKVNKRVLPDKNFGCTVDEGNFEVEDVQSFFDYLEEKSSKKNVVNSLVTFGYFGGGSEVGDSFQSAHIYDISGKTHVDITLRGDSGDSALKNVNYTIDYYKSFYDFSITIDGLTTIQVNKSLIDFSDSSAFYLLDVHLWGFLVDIGDHDFYCFLNPHDTDNIYPTSLT